MFRIISSRSLIVLVAVVLAWPVEATSTVLFDFDHIESTSRKRVSGADIEIYMEELYGSGLSVSRKATAVHGSNIYGSANLSGAPVDNSYLTGGKGKGAPAIVINFGDNPIDSFSVDFKLFKKAKKFSIFADGELINVQTLNKAQRKTGLSGQQSAFFFDTPVHTLQFVGSKKKSFAIDNLVVDLPYDLDDGFGLGQSGGSFFTNNTGGFDNIITPVASFDAPSGDTGTATINQVTDVAEPASLLLLFVGAFGLVFFKRTCGFLEIKPTNSGSLAGAIPVGVKTHKNS